MPITRGIGLTPVPRPERQYYWFSEPISTEAVRGRQADDAVVHSVRERVKEEVESGMEFLFAERDKDPNRSVVRRLLGPERR